MIVSFGNKSSFFLLWDLQVVGISPEWVSRPEQGRSSGRTASFSLWTGMFRDGISSIPDETILPLWLGSLCLVFWEQGIPWECEDDFWVGESIVICITTPYTVDNKNYRPKGRRNQRRQLKRHLDVWNWNGSTSGPIPSGLEDDDDE